MDFNQDGVIRPFIFETQHSSSSGEEENAVDEGTQGKIKGVAAAKRAIMTQFSTWILIKTA